MRIQESMYKRVLIPTDGSDLSRKAIEQGVALAKSIGASVVGITVSPTLHAFVLGVGMDPLVVTETPEQFRKTCEAHAERVLAILRDTAKITGVPYEGVHAINDHPHEAIIATAHDKQCDLIFMASHGRKGVSALVLGSETTKVLTHSKIPVLVCR
jgi:nucleotide-binding universal stress UspA family protein